MPGIPDPQEPLPVEEDQDREDPIIIVEERNFEDFDLGDEGWRRVVFLDANNSDREQNQKVIDYSEHLVQLYGTMQVLKDSIQYYFREAWAEFDRTFCHVEYYYRNSEGERKRLISDDDAVLALLALPHATIEFEASRSGKQIPTTSQQEKSRELLEKKAEEEKEQQARIDEDNAIALPDRQERRDFTIEANEYEVRRWRDEHEREQIERRRRDRIFRNARYLAEEEPEKSESEESSVEIIDDEVPPTCYQLKNDRLEVMGLQHLNLKENCNKGEENVQAERDTEEVQNVRGRPAIEVFLDRPLKVYQDYFTRDVMFDERSIHVRRNEMYEVSGEYIDGNNTIDVISWHNLKDVTEFFATREIYEDYLENYWKDHLFPRLNEVNIDIFRTNVGETLARVLLNFQDLKFYTGPSFDPASHPDSYPDCTIGLLELRGGRPVFLFFEKVIEESYRRY